MHCVYYPPEVGGLESHVHYLCRGLAKRGHDVHIVTSRSMAGVPAYEEREGVHVWRSWFPGKSPAGWIAHAAGSIPKSVQLASDADILHAQAFQSIPPLLVARALGGAPLAATWHTSHFLKLAARPGWSSLLGRLVRSADANLAASREIAEVAEALSPNSTVEPVTNGVETSVFRPVEPSLEAPAGTRQRIIVPRRLFEKNGVEYFVRALPILVDDYGLDVEGVLVGDGPERGRLERLAAEVGVTSRIRFLGAQPHDAMPGILASGRIAVFPSLMEATSVAALECMACAVPVAASRVGGLPEIIDDSVGGLFEPADPEDLARVVSVLLRRDDLSALGTHARERVVERWSNDRLVDRHLEIYESLVHRRKAG